MNTLDVIFNRRSVRDYLDKSVSDEDITSILRAAMSGPSCVNSKDWQFLVVKDKTTLEKMSDAGGPYSTPLLKAAFGVMICGDLDLAFPPAKDYFVIDGAIAGQNMIIAAESLGIGSVWLGVWPQMERVNELKKAFALPDNIVPHSLISFGYPKTAHRKSESDCLDLTKVSF